MGPLSLRAQWSPEGICPCTCFGLGRRAFSVRLSLRSLVRWACFRSPALIRTPPTGSSRLRCPPCARLAFHAEPTVFSLARCRVRKCASAIFRQHFCRYGGLVDCWCGVGRALSRCTGSGENLSNSVADLDFVETFCIIAPIIYE